jgi:hypothetical protein
MKLHTADAPRASCAEHDTGVAPGGNVLPDSVAHAVLTGATPPELVAVPNDTGTGWPSDDCTVVASGQVIVRTGMGGGGGGAVGLPHRAERIATATIASAVVRFCRDIE